MLYPSESNMCYTLLRLHPRYSNFSYILFRLYPHDTTLYYNLSGLCPYDSTTLIIPSEGYTYAISRKYPQDSNILTYGIHSKGFTRVFVIHIIQYKGFPLMLLTEIVFS